MKKAEIPIHESERLKALFEYDILDTSQEQVFDDLTVLAAKICGTPIALITMIDESRQWFKSKVGTTTSESSRDFAFCAHAILRNELFEVPDTFKDERFHDNPIATGSPNVRFYAGAPLTTPTGFNIGTLCVIDSKPRNLNSDQIVALEALARQVVSQLELRRSLAQILQAKKDATAQEKRLRDTFEQVSIGLVHMDSSFRFLEVNHSVTRMLGYAEDELKHMTMSDITHPDDLNRTEAIAHKPKKPNFELTRYQKKFLTKEGRMLWAQISTKAIPIAGTDEYYIFSAFEDISELKSLEVKNQEVQLQSKNLKERLEIALEDANIGVWEWDVRANFLTWDEQMFKIYGVKRENFSNAFDAWVNSIHPEDKEQTSADIASALEDKCPFNAEFRIITDTGKTVYIHGKAKVIRDSDGSPLKMIGVNWDITKRKENEQALANANRLADQRANQLESLFENMNEGVIVQDAAAKIIHFNSAATHILGLTSDELCGRASQDSRWNTKRPDGNPFPGKEHPAIIALKTGESQLNIPMVVQKADGTSSLIAINAVPLFDNNSELATGALSTFADLTNVQRSQVELEQILKFIPAGVFRADLDGNQFYLNDYWYRLTGLRPEQVSGRGWLKAVHPEDRARVEIEWNSAIKNIQVFESIFRFLRPDGSVVNVHSKTTQINDVSGVAKGYLGSVQDVTLLKTAEDSNTFYKIALDKAAIVAFTDPAGKITFANEMFCKISGYSQEELLGQDHRILKSEKMGKGFFKEMWKTIAAGKAWQGEICNRTKSGTYYWVNTTIIPFLGVNGKIEKYISIRRDITQEKLQQLEIAEAYKKAELATTAKSDFLYTMSHEIRTPLNGIIGMTGLLRETALNPEQKECTDIIAGSGKTLLNIINDILDFSKIEAGKMDLEETEFDLDAYATELLRPFQYTVQKKKISLQLQYTNYGHKVIGDDGKIGQVLTNLVSNAIKFTKKGSIIVRLNLVPQDHLSRLSIQVEDTGIGIPQEAKARMFQPFSQAEKSTSRNFGGTGLGLSISKRLVDLMGGKIDFESEYGTGTTFTVELLLKTGERIETQDQGPSQSQESVINPSSSPNPQHALIGRVLVAEDNSTNQTVIARMLEKWGCKYLIVANGKEVIDAIKESHFDLILMDCQMPEMDGYAACQNIRMSETPNNKIPIVALTANAVSGDEKKCRDAGMNEYLTKPIDKRDLETVLRRYLVEKSEPNCSLIVNRAVLGQLDDLQMEGKPDIVIEVIDSFLRTSRQRVEAIISSIERQDLSCVAREAHALKSSSRTLGGTALGDICQKLEDIGTATTVEEHRGLQASLLTAHRKTCDELADIRKHQDKKAGKDLSQKAS